MHFIICFYTFTLTSHLGGLYFFLKILQKMHSKYNRVKVLKDGHYCHQKYIVKFSKILGHFFNIEKRYEHVVGDILLVYGCY